MNDDDVMLICADDPDDLTNYITWVGPTDHTVRPATGKIREHLLRVREEIAQWEAWKLEQARNATSPLPSIDSLKRRQKQSRDDSDDIQLIPNTPDEDERAPWADGD